MIDIDFDENAMRHAQAMLKDVPHKVPVAAARAINRAATVGRTAISREVRKVYVIKHGAVLKSLKIDKAFAKSLIAKINVKGSPIFLTDFKVTPSSPKRHANVHATVKAGQRKAIPNGFVGRAPSGKAVYTRIGKSPYPIKPRYGPSVPQMAGNETVSDNVGETMNVELIKRLDHEVDYILGGK